VAAALKELANSQAKWTIPTLMLYEVWTPLEEINYLEEITSVPDKKIQALMCYKSQIHSVITMEAKLF